MNLFSDRPRPNHVVAAIILAFICGFGASTAIAKKAEANPPPLPIISESEVVLLPKYEVTADRVLPPIEQWKYVSIPGFEILSNASDRNTTLFVRDFYLLRQVAQIILPTIKETNPVPTYIVLCGKGNAYETFMSAGKLGGRLPNSMIVGDGERSAIVVNFTFTNQFGDTYDTLRGGNDPFHAFYLQYFRELIQKNIKPAPPTWLEEGLVQLLAAAEFSTKRITIGRIDGASGRSATSGMGSSNHGVNLNQGSGTFNGASGNSPNSNFAGSSQPNSAFSQGESGKAGSFNTLLAHRPIMPLKEFFAYSHRQPGNRRPENYSAHAYLFTHLCLYGRGQRYTKAFFKLSQRASIEPVTESVFQECFGMNFKKMEKEMRSYISFTDYKSIERRAEKGKSLSTAPDFKLRDATDAESSRIAGEVLRLVGNQDEALNRLIAPYVRGQYDADLLAALGLAELSAQHKERARRFLEAAAKADTTRTRAYVELARLRYDEIQEKSTAENRAATAGEFTFVQAPLYQGLSHPPALASIYDLLARTWYFSPSAPTKDQFETLAAGAQQNYTDLGLVYRVAALGTKHNHFETSRKFAAFGIANAPDPETKAKFEALSSQLPPPAIPEAKN